MCEVARELGVRVRVAEKGRGWNSWGAEGRLTRDADLSPALCFDLSSVLPSRVWDPQIRREHVGVVSRLSES